MRKLIPAILMLTIVPAALTAKGPPVVLLFPVKAGPGASATLATEGTQALKTYLRQTGKTEVAEFDTESPLVQRALLENRVKAEDLVSVEDLSARLEMGKRLGTDLVVGAEVSEKDNKVYIRVSLVDVLTAKVWSLEVNGDISKTGDNARARSNALQTAASTAVYSLSGDALKDVKAVVPDSGSGVQPGDQTTAPDAVRPATDAATYLTRAEQFLKAGEDASAISEYRNAISADPKNIEIRLKLVRLYEKRKLFTQAIDELARAQQIQPTDASLLAEQIKIYQDMNAPEKAAQVYVNQAEQNPKDARYRMAAGDYYWQQKLVDEAMKQYQLAVQAEPANPMPHERIALILLSQSRLDDARAEIETLQKLDPKPAPAVQTDRYGRFSAVAEDGIKKLLAEYEADAALFAAKKTVREDYYEQVKGISARVDTASKFVDALTPPDALATGHRHLALGCSLLSQACDKEISYLERNKSADSDSAAILITEAKKHLLRAEAG